MSISILLVDDHKIVRDGLKNLLVKYDDITVIGEAGNGREAIAFCEKNRPDVIIMDIAMPDMNGIAASEQILKKFPRCKIIILSMHSDKLFISRAFAAGVSGYLLKDCDIEEIEKAIRTVAGGQNYLSPKITDTVIEDYRESVRVHESGESVLTEREREVLQQIAEGKTSKEIAANLHLSVKTVDTHRQQIMDKLDIHSIAGLTRHAVKEGLVS